MTSLFEEDLHSSDSEDDDYVPDGEVTSDEDFIEDDPLADETETKQKSKKKVLDTEYEKKKTVEEPSSEGKVDKEKANDLFRSFLEEVEAEMKMKEPNIKSSPAGSSSTFDSPIGSSIKSDEGTPSENKGPEKPTCKLFEFAGETVSVESDIASSVSELRNFEKSNKNASDKPTSEPPVPKRKGLESVLTTLMNKKPKLSVLDKTSLDWLEYKKQHGISEELENFNKGRGGFIERQRFLERSDLRSYEIERDLRMSKRKKN